LTKSLGPEKLERFRRKLYEKAKREPGFRFYSLYDKVCWPVTLRQAYSQAKANRGASGVDGIGFGDIELSGVEEWLDELRAELVEDRYRPSAVRRVKIPKPGGGERPLGIPTIRDRVVQTAVVLILEPIFEADFEDNVYASPDPLVCDSRIGPAPPQRRLTCRASRDTLLVSWAERP
jgi:RNA-directed DNA polymerase